MVKEDEIYERLNQVFQDVFDDEEIQVQEDTTSNDIEDWDSLEHINLMVAIENEFQIKFSMSEITSMKNVGEMVNIIKTRM